MTDDYHIMSDPTLPDCDRYPAGSHFAYGVIRSCPAAFRGCVFERNGHFYRHSYAHAGPSLSPRLVFVELIGGSIPAWALPAPIPPFTGKLELRQVNSELFPFGGVE